MLHDTFSSFSFDSSKVASPYSVITSSETIPTSFKYFENVGIDASGEPIWSLVDDEYLGGSIGYNLSLDFGDIDSDGDYDIMLGEYNGTVSLYINTGNPTSANFLFQEHIANIDLSGYSIPKLVDIDSDEDLDLFIGQMDGSISFYENIGTNENYIYNLVSSNYHNISFGNRSSLDFIDIDNDQDLDMIVGSQHDNLVCYKNIGDINQANFIIHQNMTFPSLGLNLNPALFSIDGENKLLVGTSTGGAYVLNFNLCQMFGDYNYDLIVNVVDIVYMMNVILNQDIYLSNCSLDLNDDSAIDVLDILILVDIILM